jgi:hypothetical protein
MSPLYFVINTRVGVDIRQFALRHYILCQIATAIPENLYIDIQKFSLHFPQQIVLNFCCYKEKQEIGKATPLQPWTGPEGSRWLRLPYFKPIDT